MLKERVFEGMQMSEVADLLIDYWNSLSHTFPVAFEDPRPYMLLGTPGVFSFNKLFPSVYARYAKGGMITEDGMRDVLGLLLEETPGHPEPDFRGPMNMDFWSKELGLLIAISTNPNIIDDLYRHLQTKTQLAEKG